MKTLREGWSAAKNLLLLAFIFSRRESREIWNANFSRKEYLSLYPDVARSYYPAALHYLIFGNRDLRDPSPHFDTRSYLDRHPEVALAGINALVHFAAFGEREGRFVPALFRDIAAQPSVLSIPNVRWPETDPLVSIVIPCDSGGEFLASALQSAVDQTFTGMEIIVVEGESDDHSTQRKIRELEASGEPNVRFLYRDQQQAVGDNRVGGNRNFGIAAARGRYICRLNAGDRLDATYIEVTVFLAEALGYDLVYSSVKRLGSTEVIWRAKDTTLDQILRHNEIPVAALIRRDDWELAAADCDGGLGERHASEDWDVWIRILALGRATRAISQPLLEYRIHDADLAHPILKSQRKRLLKKYAPLLGHKQQAPVRTVFEEPLLNLGAPEGQARSVLFALPFLTFGGAEGLFRMVAGWAQEAGWIPLVVTTIDLPPEVPKDPSCFEGVTQRVYPLFALFRSNQEQLAFVHYLIQRYRVQVLVLGGSEAMYHWLPAIKAAYPDLSVADHLFNGVGHALNNRQYRDYIDATVVQSDGVAQEILRQLGDPAGKTWRIPLGVEIPEAAAPTSKSGRHEVVIGFFGRLSPEKGPDLFVEIAKQLVKLHTGLRFVIAGDGPEKEAVQKLIRAAHLESIVEMPGFVTPVRPLMSQTDIVVLPSRIDGMPAAVLEAQALGIPVVASDVGGLPEIIEDCETGYLCPAGALNVFCDRIGELIRDSELRRRIGRKARQSVRQRHGIEQMKIRYLHLLEELGRGAEPEDDVSNRQPPELKSS